MEEVKEQTPLEKLGIKQPEPEDLTPDGMFKAFECEICEEPVYLPLCPKVKEDRFERLAWQLYMIKCNEKPHLCKDCKSVYDKEIETKKVKGSNTKSDFIKEEDKIAKSDKRKIRLSDVNKAIEHGLLEYGDCLRI